jgi:hypothetical protein
VRRGSGRGRGGAWRLQCRLRSGVYGGHVRVG